MPTIQTKSFDDILRERNSPLYARLVDIRERAVDDWIHLLKPDLGSHAGFVHLRNVERNADKMIPDHFKTGFKDGEVYLLLASILLHDIGRIMPDASLGGAPPCPLRDCTCQDPLRGKPMGTHACVSRNFIESLWATLGLPDVHVARYCALLTFWHGLKAPPAVNSPCDPARHSAASFCDASVEPYGYLRLPLLAAILRIADEAENCWTRAIRKHWYDAFIRNGSSPEQVAKAFRRYVEDVEFSPEGECIIMHLPVSDEYNAPAPEQVLQSIAKTWSGTRAVLRDWADCLAPANVNYGSVFIDVGGRLHTGPRLTNPEPLADVLENVDAGGSRYLEPGSVDHFFKAIVALVRGTKGYQTFRWSAVEGAIGEPLTPRIRWVIAQMGRITPAFRVVPNPATDTVQILLDRTRFHDVESCICRGSN